MITLRELASVVRALGKSPTDAELLAAAREVDPSARGVVDFDEFLAVMGRPMRAFDDKEAFRRAWEVLDKDKARARAEGGRVARTPRRPCRRPAQARARRAAPAEPPVALLLKPVALLPPPQVGYVSTAEVRHVLTSVGEKLSREEAAELCKIADPQGLGRVQLADFMAVMTGGR